MMGFGTRSRSASDYLQAALVIFILIWVFVVEPYVWVHTYMTCAGHVLKNVFDWPVCVR